MPLKFKLKSLDGVDETLHGLYNKHDDQFFYLDVDGAVSKTKVDEFRDNNVELMKNIEDLKSKYGSVDLEKYAELLKKAEESQGKKMVELSELEPMVEDRVKTMREEYDTKILDLTTSNTTKTRQLEGLLIDSTVRTAAINSKVQNSAIEDVLLRAKQVFRLEDGVATPYEGKNVLYGKDGESPMSIGEWLTGLQKTATHLFEGSAGGGAPPGGGQGGHGDPSKMSATQKISAGLEATG